MSELTEQMQEVALVRESNRPQRKEGTLRGLEGEDRVYSYWVIKVDPDVRTTLFRRHLSQFRSRRGIIGVMFEDNTFAWSLEAPRHTSLELQENKTAVVRLQTQKELLGEQVLPVIDVFATDVGAAQRLASFIKSNAVPSQEIVITLVDSLIPPNRTWNTIFRGRVSQLQPEILQFHNKNA